MKAIAFDHTDFGYLKNKLIFKDFNWEVKVPGNEGFIACLMSPSGKGKTTLLKLMLGLESPLAGQLLLNPKNAVISYVPQESVLFDHLSILANAELFKRVSAYKKRFDRRLFDELVVDLELSDIINSKRSINEISGGQKQRLSLLRALSINPEFLLLDEPCSGLDADVKRSFLLKLRKLTNELGLLVIYVTHHLDETRFIGDQVNYLVSPINEGRIEYVSQSTISEFYSTPPSLDAAKLCNFPESKILRVNWTNDKLSLSNAGGYFLLVNDHNIDINREGKGVRMDKHLKTGKYTIFIHPQSDNLLIIDQPKELLDASLLFSLKGKTCIYDTSGRLEKVLNLENMLFE